MSDEIFRRQLLTYFDDLRRSVTSSDGTWTVKGFIDVYKQVYTISLDTKVLSKVLELLMFPVLKRFAAENGYEMVLARAQNHYPDLSLISLTDGSCYAVDVKTTYRKAPDRQGYVRVNGMTLGTFGGYFRDRKSTTTSTFPYERYLRHYVLGVVYSQTPDVDERRIYQIIDLEQIPSVAHDFTFFLQEKYRIAADRPGSGNTKNIGSTVYLDRLINGTGVFADLGIEIFDDYWMNYRNAEMARAEGFARPPYTNLIEYRHYKQQGAAILQVPENSIETESNLIEPIGDGAELDENEG